MDTLITPQLTRRMFIASTVLMIVALALSAFNAAAVLSAPRRAAVAVPQQVGFEGFVSGVSNEDPHTFYFRIMDAPEGGNMTWDQTITNVQVTNGLYSVALGGATDPFESDDFTGDRWLSVTVDGGAEILPRTKVLSVPFALNSDNANKISGGVTEGMIALFDTDDDCPTGWEPYDAAAGRVVVGLPLDASSPTDVGYTGGTALSNREDRTHTHTMSPHSHGYTLTGNWVVAYRAYASAGINDGGQPAFTINDDGGDPTGATSATMPYIQLRYCQLTGN